MTSITGADGATTPPPGAEPFKRYLCLGCGFLYDEALGLPDEGIAPGTRWADVPETYACPDCGTPKALFEMVEIGYADGQPHAA